MPGQSRCGCCSRPLRMVPTTHAMHDRLPDPWSRRHYALRSLLLRDRRASSMPARDSTRPTRNRAPASQPRELPENTRISTEATQSESTEKAIATLSLASAGAAPPRPCIDVLTESTVTVASWPKSAIKRSNALTAPCCLISPSADTLRTFRRTSSEMLPSRG